MRASFMLCPDRLKSLFRFCSHSWFLCDFVYFFFFFFFKDLFIYLFESQSYTERGEAERERERERERGLPSDGSLPHWPQQLELCQSEARSQKLLPVSHMGAGVQGLGPSSTAFPGHSRELDWKRSSRDLNQRHMGCQRCRW